MKNTISHNFHYYIPEILALALQVHADLIYRCADFDKLNTWAKLQEINHETRETRGHPQMMWAG